RRAAWPHSSHRAPAGPPSDRSGRRDDAPLRPRTAGLRRGLVGRDARLHASPNGDGRRHLYSPPMKLIVAIVHNEDAGVLVDALLEREFRATRLHSSGGFFKQSNATILVGFDESSVEDVMSIIRANCKARTQVVNPMPPIMEPGEFFMPYPLEVEVGGATVFIV